MSEQTDTIEAVADIIYPSITGPRKAALALAQKIIAVHTKALVDGAGDLAERLQEYAADPFLSECLEAEAMSEAAATIAALQAQLATARIEGVRAGIEAAAGVLERDDGFGEWWDAAQHIRRALDPAAIVEGME